MWPLQMSAEGNQTSFSQHLSIFPTLPLEKNSDLCIESAFVLITVIEGQESQSDRWERETACCSAFF